MTDEEQAKFVRMQDDLNTVKTDVNAIKVALLGDGFMSEGLVGEMKNMKGVTLTDLEKRLSKLESFKTKIIYIAAGAGLVGGWGIKEIIEVIFSK